MAWMAMERRRLNGKQWKTMVFSLLKKQWSPKIGSEEMKAAKDVGFTISKHHKNQKSIIVKKHWYSEHFWTFSSLISHIFPLPDFPSQVLVSQLAALLSRALVFAEDRPGLFAGDAGTASHLHVDRKPLLQFCALELKVADGLGKKRIFWGNVNKKTCNIYTYLYWI